MKTKLLCLILACFFSASLFSQPVDLKTAKNVAENFYAQKKIQKSKASLSLYYEQKNNDNIQKSKRKTVDFYVFKDGNNGFVIVAGDKRITPILGYSTENNFDTANMPDNLRWWLKNYQEEIHYSIRQSANKEMLEDVAWYPLENNLISSLKNTNSVLPLLTTKWGQGTPYNDLCPYDSTRNERTVVGCVATAMAQILKYWNYPAKGAGSMSYVPATHTEYGRLYANFGNTTYDWNSMTNTYTNSSTATECQAVATLMYHCGVAVKMNYNLSRNGGSGAYSLLSDYLINNGYMDARTALMRHFLCDTVIGYYRDDYYDSSLNNISVWNGMLKSELDAGRPIYYSGHGKSGGHAFVCDGYDANDNFHMNWGWMGTSNGYFTITALNPSALGTGGGSGGFNSSQVALFVCPASDTTDHGYDLKLYSNLSLNKDTIKEGDTFSISVKVGNCGDSAYVGYFSIGIHDSTGVLIDYMDSKSVTLNKGYCDSLVFSSNNLSNLKMGSYYASIYYKRNLRWVAIADGDYNNELIFQVFSDGIPDVYMVLYSAITPSSTNITTDEDFYMTANIANYGPDTFEGYVSLGIFDSTGNLVEIFDNEQFFSLTAYHYKPNFKVQAEDLSEYKSGIYYAAYLYTFDLKNYYLVNDGSYTNLVLLKIAESKVDLQLYSAITIDKNPVPWNSAFAINVSVANYGNKAFEGNLTMGIFDSTYNIIDVLKIFDMKLKTNTYCNLIFNSNGMSDLNVYKTYYAMALSRKSESDDWTVISGNTSYTNKLAFKITRGLDVSEFETKSFEPYPNPTKNKIHLKLQGKSTIELIDLSGKILMKEIKNDEQCEINLDNFSNGLYLLKIINNNCSKTYKIVKE